MAELPGPEPVGDALPDAVTARLDEAARDLRADLREHLQAMEARLSERLERLEAETARCTEMAALAYEVNLGLRRQLDESLRTLQSELASLRRTTRSFG